MRPLAKQILTFLLLVFAFSSLPSCARVLANWSFVAAFLSSSGALDSPLLGGSHLGHLSHREIFSLDPSFCKKILIRTTIVRRDNK